MRKELLRFMCRAKRRTREEQARLVEESRLSGQKQKAWCEERGINFESFRNWVSRLNRRSGKSMAPVQWIETGISATFAETESVRELEVRIGKCAVFVPSGFDGITFAQVCRILAKLC
jgi:hypothetical protein